MTVYRKFRKIPDIPAVSGKTSPAAVQKSPQYMNSVTAGATKDVAAMPAGQKTPNTDRDTGAVRICAETDDETAPETGGGKILTKIRRNISPKTVIPASAP